MNPSINPSIYGAMTQLIAAGGPPLSQLGRRWVLMHDKGPTVGSLTLGELHLDATETTMVLQVVYPPLDW